ncbi:Flavodoxin-like fold [Tindallia magadiensis]|uniref:Flavodoxin-like fold n=1 Tax=Tindallia magadiensis TaxID=69895 RepID=A0A1I3BSA6_9FIRM|nr:NAD(P)H-dependent oxidoreductase [Tindallia magadiensis]SFH65152.1 Flavodoxin-like fold [Tindallia magadiensis]
MKIGLINGSPKKKNSASGLLLRELKRLLTKVDSSVIFEEWHLNEKEISSEQLMQMEDWDRMVFSFPLYVDGIPAHFLTCLQKMEEYLGARTDQKKPYVYVMVNAGFYEGHQNRLAIDMISHWCKKAGCVMGQGMGVGAGGMLSSLEKVPLGKGPNRNLGKALQAFAEAMIHQQSTSPVFINPNFPRIAYRLAAQYNWRVQAGKNGLRPKDLSRKPKLYLTGNS